MVPRFIRQNYIRKEKESKYFLEQLFECALLFRDANYLFERYFFLTSDNEKLKASLLRLDSLSIICTKLLFKFAQIIILIERIEVQN